MTLLCELWSVAFVGSGSFGLTRHCEKMFYAVEEFLNGTGDFDLVELGQNLKVLSL